MKLSNDLEFELRDVAKPHLRKLSRQIDETINLVVRAEEKVLYIEKVESSQPIQINTKVGKKEDIYCTAVGKVILAYTNEDTQNVIFDKIDFYPHTENTIVSLKELKKALKEIKERGYAVDNEEFSEGVKCISAPIFDHKSNVKGAISITGPVERMEKRGEQELASFVKEICKDITRELGGKYKAM